jgi:hypothetical protein
MGISGLWLFSHFLFKPPLETSKSPGVVDKMVTKGWFHCAEASLIVVAVSCAIIAVSTATIAEVKFSLLGKLCASLKVSLVFFFLGWGCGAVVDMKIYF